MNADLPLPRAVLFDFDGTLADSTELILRSWRHCMTLHHAECPPDEEWLSGFGLPLEEQIRRFARSEGESGAMLASYLDFQGRHHDRLLRPFPGTLATVERLAEAGIELAIVTSKHRDAALRGMRLCSLLDYFSVIITPEDVAHPKPHPEPVLLALERLGVPAAEAVMVGDSPHDVAAGKAAGTRVAAAAWGPFRRDRLAAEEPDWLLGDISEVPPMVGLAAGGSRLCHHSDARLPCEPSSSQPD